MSYMKNSLISVLFILYMPILGTYNFFNDNFISTENILAEYNFLVQLTMEFWTRLDLLRAISYSDEFAETVSKILATDSLRIFGSFICIKSGLSECELKDFLITIKTIKDEMDALGMLEANKNYIIISFIFEKILETPFNIQAYVTTDDVCGQYRSS